MKSLWLVVAMLAACLAAAAQTQGKLSGKVTDEAGVGLPNEVVVIVNNAENTSRRVLTAADGTFTITDLPPGSYRVEVERPASSLLRRTNSQLWRLLQ